MEEILTAIRTSVCKNCTQPITLYSSDCRVDFFGWTHDETGERHCDGAPMAEPEYVDDLSGLQQILLERQAAYQKRLAKMNPGRVVL